jgi:hypothetical protein
LPPRAVPTAEEARAVDVEEALERSTDPVVVDQADLVWLEAEHSGVVAGRPFVERVQRLMGQRQVAYHDADGLGRREAQAAVSGGEIVIEQPGQAEPSKEVVHYRQGAEHLGPKPERTLRACGHVHHCIQCRT